MILIILSGKPVNIFLDTNTWLRFFIGDSEEHQKIVAHILDLAEQGMTKISTSSFVLSEFIYVEGSFYRIKKEDTIQDIEAILKLKNLWLINKTDFINSFILYKGTSNKSYKWSDCTIIKQVPPSYRFCSFDERLKKLIGEKRFVHPREVSS